MGMIEKAALIDLRVMVTSLTRLAQKNISTADQQKAQANLTTATDKIVTLAKQDPHGQGLKEIFTRLDILDTPENQNRVEANAARVARAVIYMKFHQKI